MILKPNCISCFILITILFFFSCKNEGKKGNKHSVNEDSIYLFNDVKGVSDGKYRKYYDNGKLKEIGNIKDGQRVGKFIQYYENGEIATYCYYQNGLPAYIKKFNKNGKLILNSVGIKSPKETYKKIIDKEDSLLLSYSFLHSMYNNVYMYIEVLRIGKNKSDTILQIPSDTTYIEYYLKNLKEGSYKLQVNLYEVLKGNDSIVGNAYDTLKFKVTSSVSRL